MNFLQCDFVNYNYTLKKAKCSCNIKESSSSFKDMKINKNKLLDNFKNIKNIINFNILKCFNVLFSKIGISKNVGFYILLVIILFHTITIFVFYLKEFYSLINKIKDIIISINNMKLNKKENKNEIINTESKGKKEKEIENFKNKLIIMSENNIKNDDINNMNNIQRRKKGKFVFKKKKIKIKKGTLNQININNNLINNFIINNNMKNDVIIINKKRYALNNINNISEKKTIINEVKNLKTLMDYTDDEINDLSYDMHFFIIKIIIQK